MSGKILVNLTQTAENYIKNIIKIEEEKKGKCGIYISLKKSGCSGYKYNTGIISSSEAENKIKVSKENIDIYLDPSWLSVLNNITISIENGPLNQKQLVFKNPNIDHECGCKESFMVRDEK